MPTWPSSANRPSTRSSRPTTPSCAESGAPHHVGAHDPTQEPELVDEVDVHRRRRRQHEALADDELEEAGTGLLGGLDAAGPPELEHRGRTRRRPELTDVDA